MPGRTSILAVLLTATSVLAFAPAAEAAGWLEKNFWLFGPRYSGKLPPAGFEQVREIAFRPWAPDTIPRRYCAGVALISDGIERPVYYSIGEDTGLIGATWGVEWCVVGVDRNWAFNPACKMAKP